MRKPWRLGLDLGSTALKAVLLDPAGEPVEWLLEATGAEAAEAAEGLASRILARRGLSRGDAEVVATGYGRSLASAAGRKVTEITCHARGVRRMHPDAASILDIGGQDAKAMRLGPDGDVEDFAMNDRCAAGTGRFLEVAARRHGLEVADLSAFCDHDPSPDSSGTSLESLEISSTCVVFAESELVGLHARGIPPRAALRAVHRAIAKRVALLLGRVGAQTPLYFTGGVAQNETLRRAIESETGIPIRRASRPQFAGALGAALLA